MKISILCTDPRHPVVPRLREWAERATREGHTATLCFDKGELVGGEILFLVSCSQLVGETERKKFSTILVLHASDLPRGRGWSPHVWSVVEGENRNTVSLVEAATSIDSGPIWAKTRFELEGHELLPEINQKLFDAELELMTRAVRERGEITSTPQTGDPGVYRRRRTPADGRLDPGKTIAEQFDLLRVVDNKRYPAFFDLRGKRYVLKIEKAEHEEQP
jgi:methionyl-tRNA formyltransferase